MDKKDEKKSLDQQINETASQLIELKQNWLKLRDEQLCIAASYLEIESKLEVLLTEKERLDLQKQPKTEAHTFFDCLNQ